MKKLKLAYYTTVDLGANDGPAVNETEFLKNLTQYAPGDFLFITDEKNFLYCHKNKISNIIFLPKFRLRYFFKIIVYLSIAKKISQANIDILICRISDMPILPFIYKLLHQNKKLAIKTAGLWHIDQGAPKDVSSKVYLLFNNFLIKKVYQWADAVDTALPNTQEALIEKGIVEAKKIKLIENGVNTSKFCIKKPKNAPPILEGRFPILGFMGSLPSFRGARQALETANKIKIAYPQVAAMILGTDSGIQEMIEAFRQKGIPIYAPGIVSYDSIEEYVQLMTVGFSFYEPWTVNEHGNASQKVRQYLACGKPVFSTYHNHKFLVDNNIGSIFEYEDYESMADSALKWLDRIKSEGDTLQRRIRNYAVKNLSCEHTFRERIALYQKVVNRF